MTVDEEMVDIIKCVAIFDNTATDWQKARYLEVIQKDAQRIVKLLAAPDISSRYSDDDVIITEHDEHFFFWEAKRYNLKVIKKASKKESIEYRKEFAYWQKEESENQAAGGYHELPD